MMTFLSSCSSVYYLYQAGKGQLRLLNRGKPLDDLAQDVRTDPALAVLLKKIPVIKSYGESQGLKATPNYREYVELGQDSVVYVVTVSDALAFKPEVFRFPIVGSFSYLGWFDRADALEFASKYEKQGKDVDVRGASAYSTLGWFRDPLLSSMIPQDKGAVSITAFPELVNVFLHESVHATLYIPDQSWFNESLASYVADILTERFFKEQGLLESDEYRGYLDQKGRGEKIQERMARAYQDLKTLYESGASDAVKVQEKGAYLNGLKTELGFKRAITNATLIQFKTYHPGDPGFGRIFERSGRDVRLFLKTLSGLGRRSFPEPQMEHFESVLKAL
jgi:predicted aminopeptidase